MQSFIILLLFSSCIFDPGGDDRLKIINRTNYQFSVYYNTDSIPEYPSVNATEIYLMDSVIVDDTISLTTYNRKPWPLFFERSKNKKLNLFIYNLDSLKAYGIDTLIKRKIYRKLEYSEQELDNLDWTITIQN